MSYRTDDPSPAAIESRAEQERAASEAAHPFGPREVHYGNPRGFTFDHRRAVARAASMFALLLAIALPAHAQDLDDWGGYIPPAEHFYQQADRVERAYYFPATDLIVFCDRRDGRMVTVDHRRLTDPPAFDVGKGSDAVTVLFRTWPTELFGSPVHGHEVAYRVSVGTLVVMETDAQVVTPLLAQCQRLKQPELITQEDE